MAPPKMSALPYYRWYVKDWRANRRVTRLTWSQRGAYRELLDECWIEGSIPDDIPKLAEIVGCSIGEMREMWPTLRAFFAPVAGDPTHLCNPRIDRERTETDAVRVERSRAGRLGAFKVNAAKDPQGDLLADDAGKSRQMPNRKAGAEQRREEQSRAELKANAKAIVDAWNEKARTIGYARITTVTASRRIHLESRLNEPGWSERALAAIAYLVADPWYLAHPDAIRFDVLIRPGKVDYYLERSEVPRSATESRGGARAEVDRGIHDSLAAGAGAVKGDASDD